MNPEWIAPAKAAKFITRSPASYRCPISGATTVPKLTPNRSAAPKPRIAHPVGLGARPTYEHIKHEDSDNKVPMSVGPTVVAGGLPHQQIPNTVGQMWQAEHMGQMMQFPMEGYTFAGMDQ